MEQIFRIIQIICGYSIIILCISSFILLLRTLYKDFLYINPIPLENIIVVIVIILLLIIGVTLGCFMGYVIANNLIND